MEERKTNYKQIFDALSSSVFADEPEYIRAIRKSAMQEVMRNGLPDRSDERYKYWDFDALFANEYHFQKEKPGSNTNLNDYFHCEVPDMPSTLVLLSNGWYYQDDLKDAPPAEGVIVCSIQEAFHKYPDLIKAHYNKYLPEAQDTWADLNTGLSRDGVFVYVPDNVVSERALQIVNLTHGFNEKEIFHRNLFILGKNSKARILLCDHTLNKTSNLNHVATEVYLDQNGDLELYDIQNEPEFSNVLNHNWVYQERDSRLRALFFSLHGGMIRNNVNVRLADKGAETNLYGLTLSDRQQRMDNYTHIDHLSADCNSHELYKSILDDESRGAFSGRILVRKDAQRTNAYQTNNNICLTEKAKMRTKPQLEIYADDVKCSHGATVGQLDEEAMYYLRTRGIDKKEARFMMMFAFADSIVSQISIDALHKRVGELVRKRLRGEEIACDHCVLMHCK